MRKNPTKITLYIPDAYELYPDFVGENWKVDDVKKFAEKYNLTLEIKYEASTGAAGKIIKQSRTGKIVEGTSLSITVTKKEEAPKPDNNNNQDDGQ